MISKLPLIRTMLFVPGNRLDWVEKGIAAKADAIVLDLEDAVAAEDKPQTAVNVGEYLRERGNKQNTPLFVRVNPLNTILGFDDIRTVTCLAIHGIMIPKVESRDDIIVADRLLTCLERKQNLDAQGIKIIPTMESASGIRKAFDIARGSTRVAYMIGLGARGGDLENSVGYQWSPNGLETLSIRSRVLLDARAAEVPNPLAGLWTDVADIEGMRNFANQNRQLGYDGMIVIHPKHVPIVNEVFAPSEEDIDRDKRLIEAMTIAAQQGRGATMFEGHMIDEAMAHTAQARLEKYT